MTTEKNTNNLFHQECFFLEFPTEIWTLSMRRSDKVKKRELANLCEKNILFKSEVCSTGCDTNEQNYCLCKWCLKMFEGRDVLFRWFPFITAIMHASIWIHLLLKFAMSLFIWNWIDSSVFFSLPLIVTFQ